MPRKQDLLNRDWTYPQLLLGGLLIALAIAVVVAASTSSTALGAFNAGWDGTSDLREQANAVDTDASIVLNTTAYSKTTPNETVAVILSPDETYDQGDQRRLRQFVQAGGTLVIAEDFGSQGNTLLNAVGANSRFDGQVLRDERHYYRSPALPIAPNVTTETVTTDVGRLTLNHGTVVEANNSTNTTTLIRSSEYSYLDENQNGELDTTERLGRRPIVIRETVGDGTVYVVSDPSLFINAMLERQGNKQFIRNLFALQDHVLLDYSHYSSQPPLTVTLLTLQKTPLLQVLLSLLGIGAVLGWRDLMRIGEYTTDGIRRDKQQIDPGPVDSEALRSYLKRKHPEWEEQRIRRVMRGILMHRREEFDDE